MHIYNNDASIGVLDQVKPIMLLVIRIHDHTIKIQHKILQIYLILRGF